MSDIDEACVAYDGRTTRGRAITLSVASRLLLGGVLAALFPLTTFAQDNGQWTPLHSPPVGAHMPAGCPGTPNAQQLVALCTRTGPNTYYWRWYDFDLYTCGKAPDPVKTYRIIAYVRDTDAPCNKTDYGTTTWWGHETYDEDWPDDPPPKNDTQDPPPPPPPTKPPKPDWKDGERPGGREGDPVTPPKKEEQKTEENTPKQNVPRLENRNERSLIDALKAHPGTTTTTTTKPGNKGGVLETSKPTPTTTTTHTTTRTTTKIEGEHETHTTTHETVNQTHTTTLKENRTVTHTTTNPTRLTNTKTETTTRLTTPHTLGTTRPMLSQPIRSTPQLGGLRQGGGFHLRARDTGPDKPKGDKSDKTDEQLKAQPPEPPKTDQ